MKSEKPAPLVSLPWPARVRSGHNGGGGRCGRERHDLPGFGARRQDRGAGALGQEGQRRSLSLSQAPGRRRQRAQARAVPGARLDVLMPRQLRPRRCRAAPSYSMMDHFAGLGFDVWSMDHEGYGHSSRTGSHAGIHGRRRGPEGGHARGRAGNRAQLRPDARAVLGRHPRRRLRGRRARTASSGSSSTPSPTPARTRRRSSAAARWPTIEGQSAPTDQPGCHPAHLRSRHARHVGPGGAQGACGLRAEIRQRGAERHLPRHGRQHADGRSR